MEGDYIPSRSRSAYYFWYYFSVTGVSKGSTLTFLFKNIANQARLFSHGFKPVFKVGSGTRGWRRVTGDFECCVRFAHTVEEAGGALHHAL